MTAPDADACPVVSIVEHLAKKYDVPCTLLCDTNHVMTSVHSEVIIVGARYALSPWSLTWDDENYYLVAYDDSSKKIRVKQIGRRPGVPSILC